MIARLKARHRRILRALLEALRPTGTPIDASVETDDLLVSFEDFIRYSDPGVRLMLPVFLEIIELGTFPLAGRSRPFSRLSLREREAYLRSWQESSSTLRRDLYRAIKALFCLVYYARPSVLRVMQYNHQGYAEELRRLRLERYGEESAAREAKIRGEVGGPEPLSLGKRA